MHEPEERLHENAGAGDQDQRQGEFDDREGAVRGGGAAGGGGAGPDGGIEVSTGGVEGGASPKMTPVKSVTATEKAMTGALSWVDSGAKRAMAQAARRRPAARLPPWRGRGFR